MTVFADFVGVFEYFNYSEIGKKKDWMKKVKKDPCALYHQDVELATNGPQTVLFIYLFFNK